MRSETMKHTLYFLAASVVTVLVLRSCEAKAACFQSDVRQLCCPSVCAVKHSSKWYDAQKVMNACAVGLGCSKASSVFMVCGC